jgi:hypothetical protein
MKLLEDGIKDTDCIVIKPVQFHANIFLVLLGQLA